MGSWKIIPKLDSISELFPRKKSQPIYTRVQSNIRMEVLGDCTEMGLSLDIISEIFLARNQYIVRFCVYRFSAYADHLRQNLKKCRFRPKKSFEHSQRPLKNILMLSIFEFATPITLIGKMFLSGIWLQKYKRF